MTAYCVSFEVICYAINYFVNKNRIVEVNVSMENKVIKPIIYKINPLMLFHMIILYIYLETYYNTPSIVKNGKT